MADVQERVWPGWSAAPSDLVLVEGDSEYLLNSRARPDGFVESEKDDRLGGPVRVRPRTFSPQFLATFPAFGPTPTIVVGTPEATTKTPARWVLSVLHEHFHQVQYSDPTYWAETKALGLAGNDESGMWMLNYPVPYEAASPRFARLAQELADLVDRETPSARGARDAFWRGFAEFRASLKPEDDRYLSFQLWQEGVARYVELRAGEAAASGHVVSPAFAAIAGDRPFAEAARALRHGITDGLKTETMATAQREVFYAFGAALALLLDQDGVAWRERYLREKFHLEAYRSATSRRAPPDRG
jgi:AcrR family transcriptional regulator